MRPGSRPFRAAPLLLSLLACHASAQLLNAVGGPYGLAALATCAADSGAAALSASCAVTTAGLLNLLPSPVVTRPGGGAVSSTSSTSAAGAATAAPPSGAAAVPAPGVSSDYAALLADYAATRLTAPDVVSFLSGEADAVAAVLDDFCAAGPNGLPSCANETNALFTSYFATLKANTSSSAMCSPGAGGAVADVASSSVQLLTASLCTLNPATGHYCAQSLPRALNQSGVLSQLLNATTSGSGSDLLSQLGGETTAICSALASTGCCAASLLADAQQAAKLSCAAAAGGTGWAAVNSLLPTLAVACAIAGHPLPPPCAGAPTPRATPPTPAECASLVALRAAGAARVAAAANATSAVTSTSTEANPQALQGCTLEFGMCPQAECELACAFDTSPSAVASSSSSTSSDATAAVSSSSAAAAASASEATGANSTNREAAAAAAATAAGGGAAPHPPPSSRVPKVTPSPPPAVPLATNSEAVAPGAGGGGGGSGAQAVKRSSSGGAGAAVAVSVILLVAGLGAATYYLHRTGRLAGLGFGGGGNGDGNGNRNGFKKGQYYSHAGDAGSFELLIDAVPMEDAPPSGGEGGAHVQHHADAPQQQQLRAGAAAPVDSRGDQLLLLGHS